MNIVTLIKMLLNVQGDSPGMHTHTFFLNNTFIQILIF